MTIAEWSIQYLGSHSQRHMQWQIGETTREEEQRDTLLPNSALCRNEIKYKPRIIMSRGTY